MLDGVNDPQEALVGQIVNDYQDRLARGEQVTAEEYIQRYPELAGVLRQHLSLVHNLAGWSAPASTSLAINGYDILGQVGQGGMGTVYRAYQRGTKRIVAIKVLRGVDRPGSAADRRFEREVELAASLDHPNIVTIHDSGVAGNNRFMVMRYVEGEHLDAYAARIRGDVGALLRLFAAVCRTVGYAHQHNIIHRDLKPSNILVDASGTFYILDFGLAKQLMDSDLTMLSVDHELMGTIAYMSPEQTHSATRKVGPQADVYALGVMLYELLTGRLPYDCGQDLEQALRNIRTALPIPPSVLRPDLTTSLDMVVLKALEKGPERRYASASDFAAALGQAGVETSPPVTAEESYAASSHAKAGAMVRFRTASRPWGRVLLFFGSIALLAAGGYWASLFLRTSSSDPAVPFASMPSGGGEPVAAVPHGSTITLPPEEQIEVDPPMIPVLPPPEIEPTTVPTLEPVVEWVARAEVAVSAHWFRNSDPSQAIPPPLAAGPKDQFNLYVAADSPGWLYVFLLQPDGQISFESSDPERLEECVPKNLTSALGKQLFGSYQADLAAGEYVFVVVLLDRSVSTFCDSFSTTLRDMWAEDKSSLPASAIREWRGDAGILGFGEFRYRIGSG